MSHLSVFFQVYCFETKKNVPVPSTLLTTPLDSRNISLAKGFTQTGHVLGFYEMSVIYGYSRDIIND